MKKRGEDVLKQFFLGIVLFVIIQAVFMIGGLFIENSQGILITGIPSAIGLTLILLISLYYNSKGKEYIFLGSFTLAFLAPLILFLIVTFAPTLVDTSLVNYTLSYLTILVIVVYIVLIKKILKSSK